MGETSGIKPFLHALGFAREPRLSIRKGSYSNMARRRDFQPSTTSGKGGVEVECVVPDDAVFDNLILSHRDTRILSHPRHRSF